VAAEAFAKRINPASSTTQTGWTTRSSIDAKTLPGSADASLTLSDVAPRLRDPQGSQLTETPGLTLRRRASQSQASGTPSARTRCGPIVASTTYFGTLVRGNLSRAQVGSRPGCSRWDVGSAATVRGTGHGTAGCEIPVQSVPSLRSAVVSVQARQRVRESKLGTDSLDSLYTVLKSALGCADGLRGPSTTRVASMPVLGGAAHCVTTAPPARTSATTVAVRTCAGR